ncbi:GTPase [Sulfurovum sp.]|uniref:YcjF family protein n=1 Tax=Sulfurovum sp. TaxID=1969726 RepID=UPI002868251A|nr:GTPase [Sulfurovum sp.]
MKNFFEKMFSFVNPGENTELKKGSEQWKKQLPTLWLLGKTGAGKSSLIQAFTKDSAIEIGNGFSPCTKTAKSYDYPLKKPILRFLDTRGLSEAGYDPTEDIEVCRNGSHALIIMMKADDVEQSDLVHALEKIKKTGSIQHLLIVHTDILSVPEQERVQASSYNQRQVEEVWEKEVNAVYVDFSPDNNTPTGILELKKAASEMLPLLNIIMNDEEHTSREEHNFNMLRNEIIWYAGSAGASDALPAVGLVSVPAIQGKMLHSLANQYGVEWDYETFMQFTGALGAGFAWKYSVQFAIREGVKFIPVYGQTVGAVAAVTISSATTYALGRVACKYLYHKSKGESVSTKELTELYTKTLSKGREVAENEASKK